ncbi:hypothetical protein OG440_40240 (plasmid) [Streptomyces sp. NBC_00637]|uniref:hypothetical protein n=1 Tax=Streptomyces sp. NBC_00637 TaxID=2903667 RepID=UPI002F90B00B
MTVYAIAHPDGRWLYSLPTPKGLAFNTEHLGMFADGQPMTHLSENWWAVASEAQRLVGRYQPGPKTVRYQLDRSDALSVRYPAELSVEDFARRARDGEEDELYGLYSSVTVPSAVVEHVYDGPVTVLVGREPPRPDEPQWVAQLPYELSTRPEYRHLVPGHIPGLRTHLMAEFKTMPGVEHVFDNFQDKPGVYVSLKVPFDPPKSSWRPYLGRRGQELKSGRHVPQYVTRQLTLPIPNRVGGDSYAEALAAWTQQVEFWVGIVKEASVAACGHCGGRGYVNSGSETYQRR